MPIIKDLAGVIRSAVQRKKADSAYVGRLVKNIGSGGTLGEKNFNTHSRTIGGMVKAGQHQEAQRYSRTEANKVNPKRYNRMKY
jgi:hypothetical protein